MSKSSKLKPHPKTRPRSRLQKVIDARIIELRMVETELQMMPDLDDDTAEKVWDALSDLADAIDTLREIELIKALKEA